MFRSNIYNSDKFKLISIEYKREVPKLTATNFFRFGIVWKINQKSVPVLPTYQTIKNIFKDHFKSETILSFENNNQFSKLFQL